MKRISLQLRLFCLISGALWLLPLSSHAYTESRDFDCSQVPPLSAIGASKIEQMKIAGRKLIYPFDLLKDIRFKKLYSSALNNEHISEKWIQKLNGVNAPMQEIRIPSALFFKLDICQPHSCPQSFVSLLYNRYSPNLYGLRFDNGKTVWIGNPDWQTRQLLRVSYCSAFK